MNNTKTQTNMSTKIFQVSGVLIMAYAVYGIINFATNIMFFSTGLANSLSSNSSFGGGYVVPIFGYALAGLLGYLLMKQFRYSEFFVMAYGAYGIISSIFSMISILIVAISIEASVSILKIVLPMVFSLLIAGIGFVCFKARKKYA